MFLVGTDGGASRHIDRVDQRGAMIFEERKNVLATTLVMVPRRLATESVTSYGFLSWPARRCRRLFKRPSSAFLVR